jgi:hypothetical protein
MLGWDVAVSFQAGLGHVLTDLLADPPYIDHQIRNIFPLMGKILFKIYHLAHSLTLREFPMAQQYC